MGRWTGLALASGQSVSVKLTGTVSPSATGSLANTATVSGAEDGDGNAITDPNTSNNSSTDTDTLTPQADLGITKTDGVASVVPGTNDTYTLTVNNNGPSTVTGATVSDLLPAGTTFVSATGGASYNAATNTVSYTAGTLAQGDSTSFALTLAISPALTGTLVNTATVAPPSGVTDTNPDNNSSTDTDTLTPQADLGITKTDGVASVVPGTNDTYTLTVNNNGPSTVTGATVSDLLPAGTTFVSATGGASYNAATNTVSYTAGTLAQGDSTSFRPDARHQPAPGAIRKNRCLGAGFLFPTRPLIIVVFRHSRRTGNDHAQMQTKPTATSRERLHSNRGIASRRSGPRSRTSSSRSKRNAAMGT